MHATNPDDTPPVEQGRRYAVMGVELMTPTGSIKGKVRVDTGPLRLSELVTTAHELTGVLAARAHKREAMEGKQITCRAGCASCCRQMVPMSPPEAFYLMDMIDNLDPLRKAFVLGRFESVVSRCEEENMIQPMLDIILGGDDPHRTLNKKYFVLQLACPFLVDEKCSIHDDRPIACREYNVTSPALWCTDPFGYGVEKVPMPVPLSAPLSWVTAALTGEPPALIPLPLVPRWVAEHQELRERTWPGLELFKKFMDVAAGGDANAGGSGGNSDAAGGGEATRSTP
jgi:Fe-S-cluster containining protein